MIGNYSISERIGFKLAKYTRRNLVDSRLEKPVISFSFDDFPKSAVEIGATELEAHNFLGTFYPAAALCDTQDEGIEYYSLQDVKDLAARGHEIGCHSYSHVNLIRLSEDDVAANLKKNQAFFGKALEKHELSSFAYPLGAVSPMVKKVAQMTYPICRGAWDKLNIGKIDMSLLGITALEPVHLPLETLPALLETARETNAWIVFMVHDIQENYSNCGTTPEHYRQVVEMVAKSGIEVLPVKSAAAKVMFG